MSVYCPRCFTYREQGELICSSCGCILPVTRQDLDKDGIHLDCDPVIVFGDASEQISAVERRITRLFRRRFWVTSLLVILSEILFLGIVERSIHRGVLTCGASILAMVVAFAVFGWYQNRIEAERRKMPKKELVLGRVESVERGDHRITLTYTFHPKREPLRRIVSQAAFSRLPDGIHAGTRLCVTYDPQAHPDYSPVLYPPYALSDAGEAYLNLPFTQDEPREIMTTSDFWDRYTPTMLLVVEPCATTAKANGFPLAATRDIAKEWDRIISWYIRSIRVEPPLKPRSSTQRELPNPLTSWLKRPSFRPVQVQVRPCGRGERIALPVSARYADIVLPCGYTPHEFSPLTEPCEVSDTLLALLRAYAAEYWPRLDVLIVGGFEEYEVRSIAEAISHLPGVFVRVQLSYCINTYAQILHDLIPVPDEV